MVLPLKSFYFIRHGETDWNKNTLLQGKTDIPLNEAGINQAHIAKEVLKDIEVDHIYTSPLTRAHHTASIINEELQKPLIKHHGLIERGYGELEGYSREEFAKIYGTLPYQLLDKNIPPSSQIEKLIEFEKRIISTFSEILKNTPKTPLIVAHGGVFIVLVKLVSGINLISPNCVPFLFEAPSKKSNPWVIREIK